MTNEPPARHSSGHRHRILGRLRPQILIALAVALALISATTMYATVLAPSPAVSQVSPESSMSSALTTSPPAVPPVTAREAPPASGSATASAPASTPSVPISPAATAAVVGPDRAVTPTYPGLDAQINGIINANSRYQLGVALIDMSDGVVHEYGVRAKFVAASTAKILAAAAYYHLAESGKVSLTAPMGRSTAALQIQQMVQQSNNQSWALVLGAIGYQGLHDYAASIGIDYYRVGNTLSPAEMARTLALLYTGRLLNGPNTSQLLSYMQHTNYEALIPAAVPPGISVFHKYGLLYGNLHDASILVQGGRAYAFVVYTLGQDMTDIPARSWIIHQLTQTVVAGLF